MIDCGKLPFKNSDYQIKETLNRPSPQQVEGKQTNKRGITKNKMKGHVKWFNETKDYGFITDKDGKDYFIHHSEILDSNSIYALEQDEQREPKLIEEDEVEFDVTESEKGLQATRLTKVGKKQDII